MSYSQTFLLFRARGVVYLGSVFRGRAFTSSQLLQDTLLGTHNLLYTFSHQFMRCGERQSWRCYNSEIR